MIETKTKQKTEMVPEIALSNWLECDLVEIKSHNWRTKHYGLPVFRLNGWEYAVGNDVDAQIAAEKCIKDSIWSFTANFILCQCGLPQELEQVITAFQSQKCESANDALLALVEKCAGLGNFTNEAISADGRGHFLASYDSLENEQDGYFIYRIN